MFVKKIINKLEMILRYTITLTGIVIWLLGKLLEIVNNIFAHLMIIVSFLFFNFMVLILMVLILMAMCLL